MAWHDGIPGDLGLPLVGHTLAFNKDLLGWLQHYEGKHGLLFKARVFGEISVALLGAGANRFVLADGSGKFSNHGGWAPSLGELFPGGLMLKDGADHRRDRRIMQVAFSPRALAGYRERMRPVVARHVARWLRGSWLRAYSAVKELTLEIAAQVFIGVDLAADVKRINRLFLDLVHGSVAVVRLAVPGLAYQRALRARRELAAFFDEVIASRGATPGDDMLGQLIVATSEEGERLTPDQIVDHLIFLLMAAHDTTTSALASLFYRLGENRGWQERVRDEPEALGLVLKEVLRLHPPVPALPRRTTEALEFGGHLLPAGTHVALAPIHTHRMPAYFEAPDTFDPERFAEPRAEHKATPFCYLPFGAGAHTCLGLGFAELEVGLVMERLLASCGGWHTVEGYRPRYQQVPFNVPADGVPVVFDR